MDVGSVADWVGAFGGLLAVFAAVVSWQTSEKVVKLEEKRDRERESAAERRQGEHVTVVGVQCNTPQIVQFAILVVNGSDAPIYDIRVESQRADKSCENPPLDLAVLPPGKFVIPAHPTYNWGSVIDQEVAQINLNMMAKGNAGEMITHVSFVDAAARKWELVRGRELRSVGSSGGVAQ